MTDVGEFGQAGSEGIQRRGQIYGQQPAIAHQGLHFQTAEVARRVAAGETRSPLRPLSASISVLRVLDEIRRHTGDLYADEG